MDELEKFPKIIIEAPRSMEMSRTEEAPPGENDLMQLSLSDKLKNHYNKGLKKKKRTLDNALTPEILNKTGVPMFLFTWVATLKIGILDVMPLVYAGNDWAVFFNQFVVFVMGTQMLLNWLGIRYWSSSYSVYKQRFGKDEASAKEQSLFRQQMNAPKPDSSSATLMPLVTETGEEKEKKTTAETDVNVAEKNDLIQEMDRNSGCDLTKEVEKANKDMKRREDEETNGIDDLIAKKDSPSREEKKKSAVGNTCGCESKGEKSEDQVKFPTPVVSTKAKTVTYPYWSWTPCYKCMTTRPPRCHHCDLCNACILKRDHHCFFAGACVGYRNLRFFFIFLVWSFLGSMWATVHGFPYIYTYLWDDMSYVDIVFFFAIIRWIFGYVSFQAALSVTTLSFLIYFDMITTMFIYTHGLLIGWGITSFEKVYLKKSLVIQDTRSLGNKMRAVFGKNWFAMFFIPLHFFVEPEEDPVNWPHIKAVRS